MHAIILAAGEGKRFFSGSFEKRKLPDGISYPIPKTLYPIRENRNDPLSSRVPIIEQLIHSLQEGNIEEIFIGTGYLNEKIYYFLKNKKFDNAVHVYLPGSSVDYKKGPIYTLAMTLNKMKEEGVFDRKNLDKIFFLIPGDLVVGPRLPWYVSGPSGRSMMRSRALIHMVIDDRKNCVKPSSYSTVEEIIPKKFIHLMSPAILEAPLIPAMALHVDILLESKKYIQEHDINKFSRFLKIWIDKNIQDELDFRNAIHLIRASFLGESFFWMDVDTWDDVSNFDL
ncbi:MAG: hypothetical protein ACTSVI_02795 [Promethearchaeota archaeon]